MYGGMVEWLMAPDCKSGLFGVRRFESCSPHHSLKAVIFLHSDNGIDAGHVISIVVSMDIFNVFTASFIIA